jgi:hypothetical protein
MKEEKLEFAKFDKEILMDKYESTWRLGENYIYILNFTN